MKPSSLLTRTLGGLLALSLALASSLFGQGITTAGLTGFVTDKSGKSVAGATVVVKHEPTGTMSTTTARSNGQYNLSGLRAGGPYTVTVSAAGLQSETKRELSLDLGDAINVDFTLSTDVVTLDKFTVVGDRDVTFGAGKIGTGSTLTADEVIAVPTVRRDIQDVAVLDSRLALMSLDQGGQLSAQGQNFRFNSLLIDGVQAVDTFGLSSNGFSSLKGPIPLDAIQSFSAELTPYDVRRAGFTGALLNAVIKSGTNTFHGSGRWEYTDQDMRAKNPVSGIKETFEERTYAFTLGGPILRDRLFFFLAYEDYQRTSSPPQANFVPNATQLAAVVARATALGYTPGDLSAPDNLAYQKTTIGKIDWNILAGHRLSLTYRKNEGSFTSFANYTGSTATSLSNYWYTQPRITKSYNGQLNSQWTPDFRTELTVSSTDFDGSPQNKGTPFPQVQVQGLTGTRYDTGATITNGAVFFGTESSRQLNAITTKEKQIKFSGEYSLGDHTVTAGAESVKTKYNNAFVQYTDGYYTFANAANWQAGTPASFYQLAKPFPGSSIEDAVARWQYNAYGAFLQDTWRPNTNLTVLGGLRLDYPDVSQHPVVAAGFSAAGFKRDSGEAVSRNDTTNSGNYTVAPRVGFIYNVPGLDRKTQLRGGVGLFQGKSPAVWISNAYSNAGSVGAVSATNPAGLVFNPNVNTQTAPAGNPAAPNINITDPDLVQPALWKSNLAVDHKLPFGELTFTVEAYYNKTYQALNTEFLNYAAPTTGPATTPDGRRRFNGAATSNTSASSTGRRRVNTGGPAGTGFADVFYLTNTDKGESRGVTLSVRRPFRNNWSSSLSWTHGHATEVSPITSSTASSNYSNRASFDPNENVASTSNTDIRDRIVASLTRRFNFVQNAPTTISMVYQARTGHPYSWVFRGDANGDGYTFNDLLYVPTGPTDPKVTWANAAERDAFFAFVDSTTLAKYKGGHPDRNSERSPWTHGLDIKITQELPIWQRVKAEAYLSILNVGNLLSDKWGLYEEIPFSYRRGVAGASSYNPAGNGGQGSWAYTFNSGTLDGLPIIANDNPVSRWQIQTGIAIKF